MPKEAPMEMFSYDKEADVLVAEMSTLHGNDCLDGQKVHVKSPTGKVVTFTYDRIISNDPDGDDVVFVLTADSIKTEVHILND